MRASVGLALAVLAMGGMGNGVGAQLQDSARICDSTLPYGRGSAYSWRGDRCEGTYTLPVESGLRLHAVVQSFDVDTLTAPISIQWDALPGEGDGELVLRADGLVGVNHYRMDAIAPWESGFFSWSTEVLEGQVSGGSAMDWEKLSVTGTTSMPNPTDPTDTLPDVHVPLRVALEGRESEASTCEPPRVVWWASSQPEEVYVTVNSFEERDSVVTLVRGVTDTLGRMSYPVDAPLEVEIPQIASPGLYILQFLFAFDTVGVEAVRPADAPPLPGDSVDLTPTQGWTLSVFSGVDRSGCPPVGADGIGD